MSKLFDTLASRLQQHIKTHGRAVLVIDGDCAAGKTTLAAQLAACCGCDSIHMDDFFLPKALRTPDRLAEPGGNVHYERFLSEVIPSLESSEAFTYGALNCADFTMTKVSVNPNPCVVIEGSYSLHPCFLDAYQTMNVIKVFLRVPEDEQLRRLQIREDEASLRLFKSRWIPMEKRYQEAFRSLWTDVLFTDG